MRALAETIGFTAVDVTGTNVVEATGVQPSLPAGAIARSLASKMDLPGDVPWGLRSQSSVHLDEDVAIGDQIETGSQITIFPRTHLGGRGRDGS
jgi:hypothetical protein